MHALCQRMQREGHFFLFSGTRARCRARVEGRHCRTCASTNRPRGAPVTFPWQAVSQISESDQSVWAASVPMCTNFCMISLGAIFLAGTSTSISADNAGNCTVSLAGQVQCNELWPSMCITFAHLLLSIGVRRRFGMTLRSSRRKIKMVQMICGHHAGDGPKVRMIWHH